MFSPNIWVPRDSMKLIHKIGHSFQQFEAYIYLRLFSLENPIALNLKFIFYHDVLSHVFRLMLLLHFYLLWLVHYYPMISRTKWKAFLLCFDFVLVSETTFIPTLRPLCMIIYSVWNTLSALCWHCSFFSCSFKRVSTERPSLLFILNSGFPVICYHRTFIFYFIVFIVTLFLNNLINLVKIHLKNLLYTGNYTQYLIISYNGR